MGYVVGTSRVNHPGKVSGKVGKELDLPLRGLQQQQGGRTFVSSQFLELTKSGRQGLFEGGRRGQCEMWEESFGGRRVDQGCEARSGRGKSGRGLEEGSGFANGIFLADSLHRRCLSFALMTHFPPFPDHTKELVDAGVPKVFLPVVATWPPAALLGVTCLGVHSRASQHQTEQK